MKDGRSKVAPRPAFLREEPEKAVCLGCHDREIEVAPGKKLPDMAALLEGTRYHHGLIREGRCIPCHNIHRGGQPHLLAGRFTEKLYADFEKAEYALCLSCHEATMLEVSRGKEATGFRDGPTNLHALHVHKEEKGRSCRFCHEFHGSNIPKLIRKSTPFGRKDWELPIGFQKTERGGTCSPGCHKKESYDRGEGGGS
jgi:predicted CXXCH cytochrome family protein